jgi:hypothetical protein
LWRRFCITNYPWHFRRPWHNPDPGSIFTFRFVVQAVKVILLGPTSVGKTMFSRAGDVHSTEQTPEELSALSRLSPSKQAGQCPGHF